MSGRARAFRELSLLVWPLPLRARLALKSHFAPRRLKGGFSYGQLPGKLVPATRNDRGDQNPGPADRHA
jgi:hypothetical protein